MTRHLDLAASSVAPFSRRHIDLLLVASALC